MTKFPHELKPGQDDSAPTEPSSSAAQAAASYSQHAGQDPAQPSSNNMPTDGHGQQAQPGQTTDPPISGEDLRQAAGFSEGSQASTPSSHSSDPGLQAKLAEREDQLIRLAAEVENMRKRHSQELANASKFAIEGFAEALLPVADSLEMALVLQEQTYEGLKSGVEVTLRQMQQAFERGRMSAINPVGEKFDPNRHQAVSMVDGAAQDPAVASGHVVAVMQKGYLIGDRVLRPALVAVAQ
ncbi:MAG: nucleotide exchange factor GrpE [Burkholderiaceae bacterium]